MTTKKPTVTAPHVSATQFEAFPQKRVQQLEAKSEASKPYMSPHLPPAAKARMAAAGMMAAPVEAYVPIEAPGFTAPTSEPEGVVLDLPSHYAFYSFKDLYVKPFKGLHLGKLSRAREEGSLLHTVEVVSSVLSSTTGQQHLGFKLTLPDFYFVLYWLRLNSFTKSVFVHTTTCTNEAHIHDVANGKLPAETLTMSEVIRKSNLKTIMLDQVPNPADFVLEYPGVVVVPCTMQGAIEITDDPKFEDPEFRFASQIAVYLQCATPTTLAERIAIVEDMSPDDIRTVESYEKALGEYGIVETIRVNCKTCGANKEDKIKIEASSFFR